MDFCLDRAIWPCGSADKVANRASGGIGAKNAGSLVVLDSALWEPGEKIRVALRRPDGVDDPKWDAIREVIADVLKEMEGAANVRFSLGAAADGDVRVGFESCQWSLIGRECLGAQAGDLTTSLGPIPAGDPAALRPAALHAFAHVLGGLHEHAAPPGGVKWNHAEVYARYAQAPFQLTRKAIDDLVFSRYRRDVTQRAAVDERSILRYALPRDLIRGGRPVAPNAALSDSDRLLFGRLYPRLSAASRTIPEIKIGEPPPLLRPLGAPSFGLPAAAAADQPAPMATRYTDVSCPKRVWKRAPRFPVVVGLSASPNPASDAQQQLDVRLDKPVKVEISAPDFEVLGASSQEMSPRGDDPASRAVFFLRPLESGPFELALDFWQETNHLRTLLLAIQVTEDEGATTMATVPAQSLARSAARHPDRTLRIAYRKQENTLQFTLRNADDLDDGETFAPISLKTSPEQWSQQLFADITVLTDRQDPRSKELLGQVRQLRRDAVDADLRRRGYQLWDALIPKGLKELYERERECWKGQSLVVLSDEPSIPWELVWPYGTTWKDDGPWCVTTSFSRWLRRDEQGNGSHGAPGTLNWGHIAFIVPTDSGLASAPAELEHVREVARRAGAAEVPMGPATSSAVQHLLEGAQYDWVHLVGHGQSRAADGQSDSVVWLQNSEALSPKDLAGPEVLSHFAAARPAFFFNACESAQAGWTLTGMSGWANQLLSRGAGLFLAPLWQVTDAVASAFSCAFYDALAGGATAAEATQKARAAARGTKGDPGWLAYSLYAHPNAVLAPRTVEPKKGD